MTLSDSDLERWSKLANEATPGPWRRFHDGVERETDDWRARFVIEYTVDHETTGCLTEADAAFIAEARVAIPQLLDEVRRLRAEIAQRDQVAFEDGMRNDTGGK